MVHVNIRVRARVTVDEKQPVAEVRERQWWDRSRWRWRRRLGSVCADIGAGVGDVGDGLGLSACCKSSIVQVPACGSPHWCAPEDRGEEGRTKNAFTQSSPVAAPSSLFLRQTIPISVLYVCHCDLCQTVCLQSQLSGLHLSSLSHLWEWKGPTNPIFVHADSINRL